MRKRDTLRGWAILAMLVLSVVSSALAIRAARQATSASNAAKASSVENRKLLRERARNDQERTALITEVRDQAITIKAQGNRLETLAKGQTTILERVETISRQVPECFAPAGQCTAAARANAANLQFQLTSLRSEVERFFSSQTFVVTDPAHPERAPLQVRPSCEPAAGLGNVGLLPGVACLTH